MAIYHLSVKTISRSAGRSATAAAAYRAGCEIVDERTGETNDYTRKGGVESAELVLPAGAPKWAADRAKLWNVAEQAEKRKNSTVAREIEIALPEELSPAERQRLAHDFAREIVERHGCAADVAIHAPSRSGDDRNHHAHILLTTRRLGPAGLGEKTRELDDQKTGPQIVTQWRERFANLQNERLRENGIDAQVDHRSLKAQGITDRAPTIHKGPSVTALERRGEHTHHQDRAAAVVAAALAKASVSIELEIKRAEQERPAPAQAQAQAQDLILYRAHKLERELQQARAEADQARDELQSITLLAPQHAAAPPRSREQIKLCVKIKIDSESMTLEQAQRERDRARAVFDEQERTWNAQSFIKRGIGVGKSDLFEAAQKLDAASSVVDLIERTLDQSPHVREHIDKLVIDERQRYESERETWQQYEREKRRFTAVSSDVESAEKRAQGALEKLHAHVKSLSTSEREHVLESLDASTSEMLQHQRQRGHEHEMSM